MKPEFIWGDVATWVTGIATVALFIVGFIQIQNERLSRIKSQNRAQAELISCWKAKENLDLQFIAVQNNSPQPVYQLVVSKVRIGQTGDSLDVYHTHWRVCIAIAPPGLGYIDLPPDSQGLHHRFGIEIAFIDSAGRNWVRKADGKLLQIKSLIKYYEINLPIGWKNLYQDLPQE